jgi:hypothetical protein
MGGTQPGGFSMSDPDTDPAVAAWVCDNADLIRQAIFDAACYRDEHGLPQEGREYDQLADQFSEMTA